MNERWRSTIRIVIRVVMYVAFVALVIVGQRTTSWADLGFECIGLAGVVTMLWVYNHSQR